MTMRARRTVVLEEYRKHVAERAAMGIVAKPLDATQMAALVELLKNPPAGEEEFLLDLLIKSPPRIRAGSARDRCPRCAAAAFRRPPAPYRSANPRRFSASAAAAATLHGLR